MFSFKFNINQKIRKFNSQGIGMAHTLLPVNSLPV